MPIIENSVCQEMFHTAGHNKKILPSFLCAGYANGQKDSCEVSNQTLLLFAVAFIAVGIFSFFFRNLWDLLLVEIAVKLCRDYCSDILVV